MSMDPDPYGPRECEPGEDDPGDDDAVWAEAAAEQAAWEADAEPDRGPGEITTTEQAIRLDEWTAASDD